MTLHPTLLVAAVSSLVAGVALAQAPAAPPASQPAAPARHEFILHNFKTESGVVLPEAHIVYGTYGTLNAARDNAILLPSHYMANLNGYGLADRSPPLCPTAHSTPAKLFLVTTELFGNGRSSSPQQHARALPRPALPGHDHPRQRERRPPAAHRRAAHQASARRHRLLHGRAAGLPVGGQLSRLHGPHRRHLRHRQDLRPRHRAPRRPDRRAHRRPGLPRTATTRPNPRRASRPSAWCGPAGSTRRSGGARSCGAPRRPPGTTFEQYMFSFRKRFSADANDYILQARTWESNNVGNTPGATANPSSTAMSKRPSPPSRCRCSTCLRPPTSTSRSTTRSTKRRSSRTCELAPIPSLWGHPAGAGASPADKNFLNEKIAAFLSGRTAVAELKLDAPKDDE